MNRRFRVMSYNIRKGKGPLRGQGCMRALSAGLKTSAADVVLCQEVFHAWSRSEVQQARHLAASLNFHHTYGRNAAYPRGHHGNATLSRYAIETWSNHDLSTNLLERRGILYSKILLPDSALHVFNTHLGLNKGQRLKQIKRVAGLIEEIAETKQPILLAGDFNDWTGRLDREVIRRCGLESVFDGLNPRQRRSWPNFRPLFALDRIYFRELKLLAVKVLRDTPWKHLSDHLPVAADFALLNPPSKLEDADVLRPGRSAEARSGAACPARSANL